VAIPEAKRTTSAAERTGSVPSGLTLWPPPRDSWIAIAGVALLYGGHLFYGALSNDVALAMNVVAALLVAGILISPRLREDVLRLKGIAVPAALFAAVILIALWTLTPWTPGGPHPVWSYVGISPGASTIDKSATTMEIVKLLGLGCIFLIGAAAGARDDRARFAVQLMIAAGVAFALWALLESAFSPYEGAGGHRLQAHFLNANTAGTVLAMLLCLAVAELVRRLQSVAPQRRFRGTLLQAAAVLALAVCLLDTASRGAALAFLAALLVFVALRLASGRLKLSRAVLAATAGIILLLIVVAVAGDLLVDRFVTSQNDVPGRLDTWIAHWQAFLTAPVFGYGLGAAQTVNKTLLTVQTYVALWSIRAPLNVYLQWLEEAGVVGAAPMFLCIGAIIIQTVRGHGRRSRMTGLLAGLLAADTVVLVHGFTDFGLEAFSVAAFWAWLLGLQFSLAQGSSRR
jgi:O-antigen ligase